MAHPRTKHGAPDLRPSTDALRALVRALVRDEHTADDVVQETHLRMLEKGSDERGADGLRAMASGVVRGIWRSGARRRRREERAARSDRSPSTLDVVERLDRLRAMMDGLAALPPPLREAVVRRYLDGLPPREIARASGVPVATVKTRIKRGLAALRERLDEVHGGRRELWCLPLLPLANSGGVAAATATPAIGLATTGVTVMKTQAVLVVGLGALFLAGLGSWVAVRVRPDDAVVAAVATVVEQPAVARTPDDPKAEEIATTPYAKPIVESDPTKATGWILSGRVRFRSGGPIASAPIRFAPRDPRNHERSWIDAETDQEGAFTVALGDATSLQGVRVTVEGSPYTVIERLPVRPESVGKSPQWELIIPDLARVTARAMDGQGNPLRGVGFRVQTGPRGFGGSSALAVSGSDGRIVLSVPYEGPQHLKVWPRLRGVGAEESSNLAALRALRDATLTRDGIPASEDSLVFREAARDCEADDRWPCDAVRAIDLIPGGLVDAGDFTLQPRGILEIALTDMDDEPIVGTRVRIGCELRGVALLSDPSDVEGLVRFPQVAGVHRHRAEVDGLTVADRAERLSGFTVEVPSRGVVRKVLRVQGGNPFAQLMQQDAVGLRVVGSHHEPLANATVRYGDQELVTGADGTAAIRYGPGKPRDLRVTRDGYRDVVQSGVTLSPFTAVIRMKPAGFATLVVRDARGRAVPSFSMTLAGPEGLFGGPKLSSSADGRHPVEPMEGGGRFDSLFVWAAGSGIARVHLPRGVKAGEELNVTLTELVEVEGRLITDEGKPLGGADIYSSAPELLIDLRDADTRQRESVGSRYSGYGRSLPDGTFRIFAPATDGVLCVLTADRGGMVHSYRSNASLRALRVPRAARLICRRRSVSTIDQPLTLDCGSPHVKMRVTASWPAAALEVSIPVSLRGPWTVTLGQRLDASRNWVGTRLDGRINVDGPLAELTLTGR